MIYKKSVTLRLYHVGLNLFFTPMRAIGCSIIYECAFTIVSCNVLGSTVSLNALFPNVTRLQDLLTEATKLSPEEIQQLLNQDTLQKLVRETTSFDFTTPLGYHSFLFIRKYGL